MIKSKSKIIAEKIKSQFKEENEKTCKICYDIKDNFYALP